MFSAGTIGARSFWRGRAWSSSETGGRGDAGCAFVERQPGGEPLHLIGVEHFAREQRVGDLDQRLFVLGQELVCERW